MSGCGSGQKLKKQPDVRPEGDPRSQKTMAGSARVWFCILAAVYGVDHAAGFISPLGGATHLPRRTDSCLKPSGHHVLGPALGRRISSIGCNVDGGMADEVASMRLGTIQGELRERGISYAGVFEKAKSPPWECMLACWSKSNIYVYSSFPTPVRNDTHKTCGIFQTVPLSRHLTPNPQPPNPNP